MNNLFHCYNVYQHTFISQYPHREPTLVLVLKKNHTPTSWLRAHHILRLNGEAASRVGSSTQLQTMRTVETKMPFYIASVRIWRCNITENFPQLAAALQDHTRIDWLRTIISHTHTPLLRIVAPYIWSPSVLLQGVFGNVTIQNSVAWVWLLMYRFVSVVFSLCSTLYLFNFGQKNLSQLVSLLFLWYPAGHLN